MKQFHHAKLCALMLGSVIVIVAGPASAAGVRDQHVATNQNQNAVQNQNKANTNLGEAQKLIDQSKSVVTKMKQDPNLAKQMAMAKGILIFPEFGHGAFIVGGRGGTGLLLTRVSGHWSDPVFFDMGGGSIGAQIGGSGGQIAFLLMSDQAVDKFRSGNNFSINAGAGFTVANYSAHTQASSGKGADVIVWSDMSGAYAGATASLTNVGLDKTLNQAFYGSTVDPQKVLNGQLALNKPKADQLKSELPA